MTGEQDSTQTTQDLTPEQRMIVSLTVFIGFILLFAAAGAKMQGAQDRATTYVVLAVLAMLSTAIYAVVKSLSRYVGYKLRNLWGEFNGQ